ncbi:unnamed protein product [Rhizophagus irregularis]|nr:unnamed protein product [Rhizophagus irregularis]
MSSTPYIEIDWSSTSQHSFPQLGEPTPPENNSDDILYNSELPAVLSAKDILSLDIDLIRTQLFILKIMKRKITIMTKTTFNNY